MTNKEAIKVLSENIFLLAKCIEGLFYNDSCVNCGERFKDSWGDVVRDIDNVVRDVISSANDVLDEVNNIED